MVGSLPHTKPQTSSVLLLFFQVHMLLPLSPPKTCRFPGQKPRSGIFDASKGRQGVSVRSIKCAAAGLWTLWSAVSSEDPAPRPRPSLHTWLSHRPPRPCGIGRGRPCEWSRRTGRRPSPPPPMPSSSVSLCPCSENGDDKWTLPVSQ